MIARLKRPVTRAWWPLVFALVAAASAACGGPGDPPASSGFPPTPLASLTSDSGALSVEVRTSPSQPPPRGAVSVEYRFHDTKGAPVEGLSLAVVPWMPAHAHGASVQPTVSALGGGRYVASGVSLFMPGHWELRTSVSGSQVDHFVVAFDVP